MTSETQFRSPDNNGNNVLNTEMEVIGSRDVARAAVTNVGAQRILGKGATVNDVEAAAEYISKNLIAELPKNNDVITLKFKHTDPSVPQDVLAAVMKAYKEEHVNLHMRDGVTVKTLNEQADHARSRLDAVERLRHQWMNKVGVLSYDDAKKDLAALDSKLQDEIIETRADLMGAQATIAQLQGRYPQTTNELAGATNAPTREPVPADKTAEYESICQSLDKLQADQNKLLTEVTTNNAYAQAGQAGIDNTRKAKEKLEAEYPGLLLSRTEHPATGSTQTKASPQDLMSDAILKVESLTARISILTNALADVQAKIAAVGTAEVSSTGYTAERDAEKETLERLLSTINKVRINDTAGPGQVSNIGDVESPTPPSRDVKKIMRLVMGTAVGGLFFSLALAFAIEFYFNRTFRLPLDVQNQLPFPFFVSIPNSSNGRSRLRLGSGSTPLALPPASQPANGHVAANGHADATGGEVIATAGDFAGLEPWEQTHALRPFYETLRDRLISYFEMINLTHKPKIVAITSCNAKAGVTTVATGLAAALSETGEGNVLLVNMNAQDGEAHHFYKGKRMCDLDRVLEKNDQRKDAQVLENLYVAREGLGSDALRRALPKQFSQMVPKMKASDFDYIIFDMPAISQISITPRLARFMDMVLMVVESDKTDRDVAKRAAAMLAETKTNVGVILNKTRSYIPKRLQQEL
jgi:Mrp family chromosome partitioning ATPase/uncharacterized protein involved in exopolysaccharide biosynthesis